MYKIYFYEKQNGEAPVYDWLTELSKKSSKDSRINYEKANDYLTMLANKGLSAGEPFMKHLDGDIWELRPLRNRIFLAAWSNDGFILLHQFLKRSQKTPKREIEKAKSELKDMKKREGGI